MIADEPASWIDVSVPIRPGMVTFDGDPAVHLERTASLPRGAVCNVSRLVFGVHSGTHVDAPVHFIEGAAGIESISLDRPLLIPGSDGGPARAMVRRVAR